MHLITNQDSSINMLQEHSGDTLVVFMESEGDEDIIMSFCSV